MPKASGGSIAVSAVDADDGFDGRGFIERVRPVILRRESDTARDLVRSKFRETEPTRREEEQTGREDLFAESAGNGRIADSGGRNFPASVTPAESLAKR